MTEHGAHPGVGTLLWPVLNFLLFAALIARLLPGPIREFFRQRTERLRAAMAAGRNALAEAEQTRAALDNDVRELPTTIAQLKADIRAAGDRQRSSLLDVARSAADRIRNDARLLAEQEVAAARQALRTEVADEAIRQATDLIRGGIRPEDQERLVRDFVHTAGRAA